MARPHVIYEGNGFRVQSEPEREEERQRVEKFNKRTQDAQFDARLRRHEQERREKEARFEQELQTQAAARALNRSAERLPELQQRGNEALRGVRIQQQVAQATRANADVARAYGEGRSAASRDGSTEKDRIYKTLDLIRDIEQRDAATPGASNLPRRDADIHALVGRDITADDQKRLAEALGGRSESRFKQYGTNLLSQLENKRQGLDAAYQHHDPKNIARRSLVDPLRATRESDGWFRSLQHKAGLDTAGFDLGMAGHGGLDPIDIARSHSPEAVAEAARILQNPAQRQQILDEAGITLPGRPLSVKNWFANKGAPNQVDTTVRMSHDLARINEAAQRGEHQRTWGTYGENFLADHGTGIYKVAAEERIAGYIDHLNSNPNADDAAVRTVIDREYRRRRVGGALDIYGLFVPTGGQGLAESVAYDVIPAAVGGAAATKIVRAVRPSLITGGRRERFVAPLVDEVGEMVADYGIVGLTNPAALNSGGTHALLIGGNLAPGLAAGPFSYVPFSRRRSGVYTPTPESERMPLPSPVYEAGQNSVFPDSSPYSVTRGAPDPTVFHTASQMRSPSASTTPSSPQPGPRGAPTSSSSGTSQPVPTESMSSPAPSKNQPPPSVRSTPLPSTALTPSTNATPTQVPTETPTETPSEVPTETPTEVPTETPTETPSETPQTQPEPQPEPEPHIEDGGETPNPNPNTPSPSPSPSFSPSPTPIFGDKDLGGDVGLPFLGFPAQWVGGFGKGGPSEAIYPAVVEFDEDTEWDGSGKGHRTGVENVRVTEWSETPVAGRHEVDGLVIEVHPQTREVQAYRSGSPLIAAAALGSPSQSGHRTTYDLRKGGKARASTYGKKEGLPKGQAEG